MKTPLQSTADSLGSESNIIDLIHKIALYLNLSFFGVYMILQAIVLYRVRFTLDVSAIVTLSCYSLIMLCRTILWIMYIYTGQSPDEEG